MTHDQLAVGGEAMSSERIGFFSAGLLAVARLAAVAAAAIIQTEPAQPASPVLLAGLFTYAFVRAAVRRETPLGAYLDATLAAGALLLTGGAIGPFLAFGLVAATGAGMTLGPVRGTMVAVGIAVVASAPLAVTVTETGGREIVALWALHPLLAALAGLLVRVRERERPPWKILTETNRALTDLHALAQRLPYGLEPRNVLATSLRGLQRTLAPSAAGIVLRTGAGPALVEARGLTGPVERDIETVDDLLALLPEGDIRRREIPRGLGVEGGALVAVLPSGIPWTARRRSLLDDAASSVRLALANASLFRRISDLSADAERRRIAHELHDGVAQSLAHLRLELNLLRRREERAARPSTELTSLAKLADRTLADVRDTIAGLRPIAEPGGLPGTLAEHVADLREVSGRSITLRVGGQEAYPVDLESQVFRIAQEALSNALRHSGAHVIDVELSLEPGHLVLVVSDDGRGMPIRVRPGVGLAAMRERAASMGAQLAITVRPSGGTTVHLEWTAGEG